MRSIAIINQKGGVGKTTTAVNLSAALARAGQRVGLIDIDPQAHASLHLGLDPQARVPTVYDLLTEETRIADLWQRAAAAPSRRRTCGSRRRTSTWPPPKSSWPASSAAR